MIKDIKGKSTHKMPVIIDTQVDTISPVSEIVKAKMLSRTPNQISRYPSVKNRRKLFQK